MIYAVQTVKMKQSTMELRLQYAISGLTVRYKLTYCIHLNRKVQNTNIFSLMNQRSTQIR